MAILTQQDVVDALLQANGGNGYQSGALNLYNQNFKPLIDQATQLGFQNDPNFQNILGQYIQSMGGANAGNDAVHATYKTQLNNLLQQQGQLNQQNQQLQAFDKMYQGQMFGTDASGNPLSMVQSLQGNTGSIGALNQFETQQTADTFNKLLSPEISMALGGQGLQNSGANVELQSKALAGLQLQQQQSIMNAALGAQSQEQGLQQQAILGNISGQQGMVSNTLNSSNALLTLQYQQQLMQQQADLARQLSQFGGSGGGGIGSVIGGAIGAGIGAFGGPAGMAAGFGIGSSLGGGIGNSVSPGTSGMGMGALGSSFFAASSSLPRNFSGQSIPTSPYNGPMNAQGSPWAMSPMFG